MTTDEILEKTCEMLSAQTGLKVPPPSEQDRLHVAIITALTWLEMNAPSRAYEVLKDSHDAYVKRQNLTLPSTPDYSPCRGVQSQSPPQVQGRATS